MTSDPPTAAGAEPCDLFFSDAVKAVQTRRGSRAAYARQAASSGFRSEITPDLAAWLGERDSVYLASASAAAQPYIQHRGGPPGFLRVLDSRTLAFADYRGNRQYITTGNLAENDRAMLFVMDYANRNRIKIWGRAEVVENDPALITKLMPENYKARPEQVIVFHVDVWDANCPQHIPQKIGMTEITPIVRDLRERITELERELAEARSSGEPVGGGASPSPTSDCAEKGRVSPNGNKKPLTSLVNELD